jgi:hypothetical protein
LIVRSLRTIEISVFRVLRSHARRKRWMRGYPQA